MREIRELIGANITLTCVCDNSDEFWTLPRNTTEGGFLNIFSLSAANAGSYTCDNGNKTENVTVIVQAISKPFPNQFHLILFVATLRCYCLSNRAHNRHLWCLILTELFAKLSTIGWQCQLLMAGEWSSPSQC